MAEWITARGERHKLDPDSGGALMGTVCKIKFRTGEPSFPVLGLIPASLAPVCKGCAGRQATPELITDQRHGLHTGSVTRYVSVTGKNGGRWHGGTLDAVQAVRGSDSGVFALCEGGPFFPVTDDAGSLVAYAPTDVTAEDADGERVKWCVGCSAVFKALKTEKPAATLKNTNPENVDRFGHTPDAGQRIETMAARLGRVVPMLGITPADFPATSAHSLPMSALVDLGGVANGKKVIHAGGKHKSGSVELICRDELIVSGSWTRPTGEGDDTPKLTCTACRNALFIKGPARSRAFKSRILALVQDGAALGNRPVGQTWGTLWDNSQDPARKAERFDVATHGERAVKAKTYDHGAATGQTLAGPGGKEAKTAVWSTYTLTLDAGNVVRITLHRDHVHSMGGMFTVPRSTVKLTGWDYLRRTGKLPAAVRYSMTPEQKRRLYGQAVTPAEKRAAARAKAVKAQERAEYARNRDRAHGKVSAVQVTGDIYAGFLNRPGRVRDVQK